MSGARGQKQEMATVNLLHERMIRDLPQTADEALLFAARISIATHGPMEERLIRAAARGLAKGMFGEAWRKAGIHQRRDWIDLAEQQYRKALG